MKKPIPLQDELKKFLIPAFERKAKSIQAIDVKELTSYTNTLIIIEGNSNRQVTSIAQHLIKSLKNKKIKAIGAEGIKEGEWALLDYGDVIIHIFESQAKSFYDLDGFWADAQPIDLSEFEVSFNPEGSDD
ncbi:MAG: ribosome silencing factor [Desulfobacteraceae bacterium]|nr:ribosome silencing factor [Desulfobacteraceae bacterium]